MHRSCLIISLRLAFKFWLDLFWTGISVVVSGSAGAARPVWVLPSPSTPVQLLQLLSQRLVFLELLVFLLLMLLLLRIATSIGLTLLSVIIWWLYILFQ